MFSNFQIILNLINEEISFRKISGNRVTTRNFTILFKRIIKALELRNFIRRKLSKESISESIVFYSYWLKAGANAIALLDYNNSIKISRAHGSDIYEEKTATGYLPLLRFSGIYLNAIFFASKDGKEYFKQKTKVTDLNLFVSYLGVTKPDFDITKARNSNRYTIVSCSNMITLKRIDLIISALAIVKSAREIEWLHFGDGILRKDLEETALMKLGSANGIKYRFMGYYANEELIKFYSANRIDLFINASSTEGLPVSIMEAQSFGIPVIATDIGGVSEVVTTGTGSLIPANFLPGDLAQLIEQYLNLSEQQFDLIRENAIKNWESKFNAASNYEDFIQKVSTIFASGNDLTQQF
jgi:glycosyltransferase involved in cell wall biosynthesis